MHGTIHIDAALTNVAVQYKNDTFIADRILPVVPVTKQSDKWFIYGKEALRIYDDIRVKGAEAKEVVSWSVTSSDNYYCDVRALKDLIADEDRDNADVPLDPDINTTEGLVKMRLLRREYDVANYLFNTATFSGKTAAVTTKWDDYTNSAPIRDIEAKKEIVHDAIGLEPNVVVIGYSVFKKLKHHPDMLERIKYTQKGVLTPALLADILDVDEVIVGGGLKESAVEGQTSSLTKMWGKYALIMYRQPGANTLKVPALGFIPTWKLYGNKTYKVKKYRVEERNGDMVEVESAYDVILACSSAGYLLSAVIS